MRLFIAIAMPPHICEHLQRMQDLLRPLIPARWTNAQLLHLTLKFLGQTPDANLPDLIEALNRIEIGQAIPLRTTGVTCFPPHGPIRIIAAALADETENCQRLQGDIERACHGAGFPLEGRRWTPHVTLGRVKDSIPSAARAAAAKAVESLPVEEFETDGFSLIESRLDRNGPSYIVVAEFPSGSH